MCKRRGLKVNTGESKVMVLNGEEKLVCEVNVYGISWNLNIWGVLDGSGRDGAECSRKVASGRRGRKR